MCEGHFYWTVFKLGTDEPTEEPRSNPRSDLKELYNTAQYYHRIHSVAYLCFFFYEYIKSIE